MLLYGGYLAINGQATVGDIAAFNAYVLMLQPPFRQLGMVLMMGQRAAASAQRIYEVLDEQPTVVDRPGAVDLVECRGDVHFDDVSFDYANGTPVLHGFELHLRPGETVALVGRTGTGKSTAARLLARFYDVTGGAVRIDGHDVRDLTLPSLRHHIGMVLDEPFLFSVSIRDNIAYGRPDAHVRRGRRRGHAPPAPTSSSARCPRATTPSSASAASRCPAASASGSRSPARCVVNPPILVLDDATSAIDVQIEQQIHAALERLMTGRTTLIIAHRLSTISLADRSPSSRTAGSSRRARTPSCSRREPRYVEILAQTEEDARRRAIERDAARAELRTRGPTAARGPPSTTTSHAAAASTPTSASSPTSTPSSRRTAGRADGVGRRRLVAGSAAAAVAAVAAGREPGRRASVRGDPRGDAAPGRPRSSPRSPTGRRPTEQFSHRMPPSGVSLARLLRPHRRLLLVSLVLVVIEAISIQLGPLLGAIGIDQGIQAGNMTVVVTVAVAAIARGRRLGGRRAGSASRSPAGSRRASCSSSGSGCSPTCSASRSTTTPTRRRA